MELVIKNGKIIDGTGNPWFKADIGIQGEKIAKIGKLNGVRAETVINVNDLIICPGFIDVHSHTDGTNFVNPKQESSIRQGITTHIAGNCGYGLAPINPEKRDLLLRYLGGIMPLVDSIKTTWTTFHDYLKKIEEVGIASNMKLLLGHGTLRIAVMGFDDREPTEKELEQMKDYVSEAMEAGALGLSTGLYYPPGWFAKTDEIIELCKVVAKYKGYYYSHIRSYAGALIKAINEAIEIGEKSGVPVQISHASVFGPQYWGRSKTFLKLIKKARERGIEVSTDVHPYDSTESDILMLLPPWSYEGGKEKSLERLKDPELRKKIIQQQRNGPENRDDWPEWQPPDILGLDNILPIRLNSEKYKSLEGKNLVEIAEIQKSEPILVLIDLLIEEELNPGMIMTHWRGEKDIINFMKSPYSAFETDAGSLAPYGDISKALTHPRAYGTYPKLLGEFVRERNILTLETAIRKMTSLPAQMANILDRGLLRKNNYADVVIFNPETIIDTATYENPHQYPIGIEYVIVNGKVVIDKGEHTGLLPGKVLRHQII